MAKTLHEWIETDVQLFRERPMEWLSEHHFFRDPMRPTYSDPIINQGNGKNGTTVRRETT